MCNSIECERNGSAPPSQFPRPDPQPGDIYRNGEEAAYETFRKLRWPETNGEPVCPRCGCLDSYALTKFRRFKCAACAHQFSPTSGTILHSRKLSYVDLLAAICLVANAAKGLSALQLARDIGCNPKSAAKRIVLTGA